MVREFYIKEREMTLEQLAGSLDDDTDPCRYKTMVRRLYDIANVYKAVGLVKKTNSKDRSVAYRWLGRMLLIQRD